MFASQLVIIKVLMWINILPCSFLPQLADSIVRTVCFVIFTLYFVADLSILRSGGGQMSNKCRGVELANVRGQNVLWQHSLQTSGPIKRRLSSSLHLHMVSKTEIWEQHTSLRKRVVMQWGHIRHCSTRLMSVSPNQTHQNIIMI